MFSDIVFAERRSDGKRPLFRNVRTLMVVNFVSPTRAAIFSFAVAIAIVWDGHMVRIALIVVSTCAVTMAGDSFPGDVLLVSVQILVERHVV